MQDTHSFFGCGVSLQRRTVLRASITPRVSIVIAAWNEAPRPCGAGENCLKQEYPVDRLEVIVVSDGSSDQTESVVWGATPASCAWWRLPFDKAKLSH